MTKFPYCILLLFYSHHQVQSASGVGTAIGATPEEKDNRNATIIEKLSKRSKNMLDGDSCFALGPRDCSDIRAVGFTTTGVYRILVGDDRKRMLADVYCDFSRLNEGWLVFQRRKDGSVNFERTWIEYKDGFGNPGGEFWLGNEALYLLTSTGNYKLRIDMEDFDGKKKYAEYSTFSISSSADKYRLTVSGYTGDAGDSLLVHSGMQFSTKDADNDVYRGSCSRLYHGAWWYIQCHASNLNGLYLRGPHTSYGDGVEWYTFEPSRADHYSLKTTELKMAAIN